MSRPNEHLSVHPSGFALFRDEKRTGEVQWNDIEKVIAFKDDLITSDLVCLEFHLIAEPRIFEINEEVAGYAAVVAAMKAALPDLNGDWEREVTRVPFERSPVIVYERSRA